MEKTATVNETSSKRIAAAAAETPTPTDATPASSAVLNVINWEEAMTQVGGEVEFLEEILQDLLEEAQTAEEDIKGGIETKDFDRIMKAAHRIKGSATYLGCEALRVTAYAIQQLGLQGTKNESEELWKPINDEYELFLSALTNLRAEIARWKSEPK
jgi:HPt (histidine-containing phosphotransfer) domain-containing protein